MQIITEKNETVTPMQMAQALIDAEIQIDNPASSLSRSIQKALIGKEPMIDALIEHTGKLCKHIVSKEWNMALMDIDMLIDGINRAKAFKEQEDDE